jgi:hypothetical protein
MPAARLLRILIDVRTASGRRITRR